MKDSPVLVLITRVCHIERDEEAKLCTTDRNTNFILLYLIILHYYYINVAKGSANFA